MNWVRKTLVAVLLGLFLLLSPVEAANASPARQGTVPAGFELIDSSPGISLYKKDYPGGNPDYVQVVDLSAGASIELLHGPLGTAGSKLGIYGGPNPNVKRQSLRDVWNAFAAGNQNAFCLANGQFFSPDVDPTELSFPLLLDGEIVSEGYDRNYSTGLRVLELWPDKADIRHLTEEVLNSSSAPDLIAGLSEDTPKNPDNPVGRTFVGVSDRNGDGVYETVLILGTRTAFQSEPGVVLRGFGAAHVMMLDGGGSTQLICHGSDSVQSTDSTPRTIPQTLGTIAASGGALVVQIVAKPDLKVVVAGESLDIAVELKNVGAEIWRPETDRLVNSSNPWGAGPFALAEVVLPGGQTGFSWTTEPLSGSGIRSTKWHMARGEEAFFGDTVEIRVIVLPQELSDKKKELEQQLATWSAGAIEDVEQLAKEWIQKQLKDAASSICSFSTSIPLLIVAIVLGGRRRIGKTSSK